MRDIKRIRRITKLLEQLWNEYPDQRLGQLLENYVFGHHDSAPCIFYIEDDLTEARLKELMKCIATPVSSKKSAKKEK